MFRDILLAVDLNEPETQQRALEAAVATARAHKARLHVVTVVPDFGMSIVASYFPADFEHKAIEDAKRRLHEYVAANVPKGIQVQHIVGHGTVYKEIIQAAREVGADLIVLASHRPELKDYLLGPNATHVVKHADCSVLVVRE